MGKMDGGMLRQFIPDLDNPYGRYYGKARSREDLRK
jgi:hypothetical protein